MRAAKPKQNGKKQSDILVGVALILLSAVFVYIALSQPKVSNDYVVGETETELYSPSFSDEENDTENEVSSASSGGITETENSGDELSVTYPINLNTCTAQELMRVDGIGETRAAAILSYREHLGGYTSVEQIKDISGIGDATYETIAPYLTV